MIWSAVAHVFSVLLELIHISRMSDQDKDLEILVLRYQLGIADRKLNQTIRVVCKNSIQMKFPRVQSEIVGNAAENDG